MSQRKTPNYRRQKRRGSFDQAIVEIDGRRHYLGEFDSSESKQRYHQLISEWLANGRAARVESQSITIVELAAQFWRHCEAYYRHRDGSPTSQVPSYRGILRILRDQFGYSQVVDFGPNALKCVRQSMIDRGWCRTNINSQVGRVKHIFKWGVAEELVPSSVYQALTCVPGLKAGRCGDVREKPPVRAAPDSVVDAIRPFVSRQVWAIVQLQRLTGAPVGVLVLKGVFAESDPVKGARFELRGV